MKPGFCLSTTPTTGLAERLSTSNRFAHQVWGSDDSGSEETRDKTVPIRENEPTVGTLQGDFVLGLSGFSGIATRSEEHTSELQSR